MSWEYVQEILDFLEEEFENRSLRSGYGFLFDRDGDTIIGHKYRRNRILRTTEAGGNRNNYGTSLIVDHGLTRVSEVVKGMLRDPVVNDVTHVAYEYPPGTAKISGLAEIDHEYFNWVCGVGMNDEDIFSPVQELKNVLIAGAILTSLLVVLITFWAARQFTTPLKELTATAQRIARGDSSQRARISTGDEIGELAATFNDMAEFLEERSHALIELNRRLEEKVLERTGELEESHRTIEEAYEELKEAQVQLVQSEENGLSGPTRCRYRTRDQEPSELHLRKYRLSAAICRGTESDSADARGTRQPDPSRRHGDRESEAGKWLRVHHGGSR